MGATAMPYPEDNVSWHPSPSSSYVLPALIPTLQRSPSLGEGGADVPFRTTHPQHFKQSDFTLISQYLS